MIRGEMPAVLQAMFLATLFLSMSLGSLLDSARPPAPAIANMNQEDFSNILQGMSILSKQVFQSPSNYQPMAVQATQNTYNVVESKPLGRVRSIQQGPIAAPSVHTTAEEASKQIQKHFSNKPVSVIHYGKPSTQQSGVPIQDKPKKVFKNKPQKRRLQIGKSIKLQQAGSDQPYNIELPEDDHSGVHYTDHEPYNHEPYKTSEYASSGGGGSEGGGKDSSQHGSVTYHGHNGHSGGEAGQKGSSGQEHSEKSYGDHAGYHKGHHKSGKYGGSHHKGEHGGKEAGHKHGGHKDKKKSGKGYRDKYHKDEKKKYDAFWKNHHESGDYHEYGSDNKQHNTKGAEAKGEKLSKSAEEKTTYENKKPSHPK